MKKKCSFCSHNKFRKILNLGKQPLANSYLNNINEFKKEVKVELSLEMCLNCNLFQVPHNIYPKDFFLDYDYLSGASKTWVNHCKKFSKHVVNKFNLHKNKGEIIEIASNDGVLLRYFQKKQFSVVGIEPSINAVKIARRKKIFSILDFFDYKFAKKHKSKYNPQLVIANNVIAHVKNLNSFVKGLYAMSNNETIICVEIPHILNLFNKYQFDTIYHEHHYYYSLKFLIKLFKKHDLKIFEVELIKTHGGSLRIFAKRKSNKLKINKSVTNIIKKENTAKIYSKKKHKQFRDRIFKIKKDSMNLIKKILKRKKTIDSYGAAAKGNTLLNFLEIKNQIRYVYDANKLKQNKYLPGSHIKITNPNKINLNKPDYILILPWNVKHEIIKQISFSKKWNCKFITLIPKININ